jgi:dimethylhistidine N-methyltransferase
LLNVGKLTNFSPSFVYILHLVAKNIEGKLMLAEQIIDKTEAEEIIAGLSEPQKTLPSKLFYDEKGSKLFDLICELPEYYPTRTETKIIQDNIEEIVSFFDAETLFVELGSGSSAKTKIILNNLSAIKGYLPIDISEKHLKLSTEKLREEFSDLRIIPLIADYTKKINFPEIYFEAKKKLMFFPGSTIGNFEANDAKNFLSILASELNKGGYLLIGIDLQKDVDILLKAYNDSQGITAAFNLNILTRLNNEFGFDFYVESFHHKAECNSFSNRIEMFLYSSKEQTVSGLGKSFRFTKGESILTEYSHKYTIEEFLELCDSSFVLEKYWTDKKQYFALLLLSAV